ncbi:MAG: Crp/Fnr family transcriptional regulator [Sedimentibacter sp.]|uniref:Crp/Fnr family transcriptional regulator n=1 Tax=Sedimentibacter sp. TaxID=1960295 RepID=UPI00315949DD
MNIQDAHIYPYIKNYLDRIPVATFKKGTYFSKAENRDNQIYYILSGNVNVESFSEMGKKVLVDSISENEFAGQISYIRQSNFYCNSLAVTDVKMLCLKEDLMSILMKNLEFSTVFYFKTSSRIYIMYKKMLMNSLFSQCELVAYYIIDNSHKGQFVYKSIYDICEKLNISRRSFYNIINKFVELKVLEKGSDCIYFVKDDNYLIEKSDNVKRFMENTY